MTRAVSGSEPASGVDAVESGEQLAFVQLVANPRRY